MDNLNVICYKSQTGSSTTIYGCAVTGAQVSEEILTVCPSAKMDIAKKRKKYVSPLNKYKIDQ